MLAKRREGCVSSIDSGKRLAGKNLEWLVPNKEGEKKRRTRR